MRVIVSSIILSLISVSASAQQCITTAPPKGAIVPVKGVATSGGLTKNFKNTGPLWLQNHGYPVSDRNIWIGEPNQPAVETPKQNPTTKRKEQE